MRKRALSSEEARRVRQAGHDDALAFAKAIGVEEDYKNNRSAKKDVFDLSGDTYSVKSGRKKWQIFLYGKKRFESDPTFQTMNGIGAIIVDSINAFPEDFAVYVRDKQPAKVQLQTHMKRLAERLQDRVRLRAFILKSMFDGGQVDYLSIKHDSRFHVFHQHDVLDVFEKFEVGNSLARKPGDLPAQKVLLKYKGVNVGEIEMRNDSEVHYREVRFNMYKTRAVDMLFEAFPNAKEFSAEVLVYGRATKTFGNWRKKYSPQPPTYNA